MSTEDKHIVVCADCTSNMILKKDQKGRKYYLCSRVPACLGNHSAHPDGSPVGIPGDKETRRLRTLCHDKLDALWESGECSRQEAYVVLQKILHLSEEEAHIGKLNKQQCLTFLKQFDMLGSAVTILIPQRD
jgi:ssDNA-binding Zn-finger/Zn-ribbon topoisomerase 1